MRITSYIPLLFGILSLSATYSLADENPDNATILDALTIKKAPLTRSLMAPPDPFAEMKKRGLGINKQIPKEDQEHFPNIDVTIEFEFNSSVLTSFGKKELDRISEILNHEYLDANILQIGGHTDAVGSQEYNRQLGQARADSVVEYLITQHDFYRTDLKAVSYGEDQLANEADPASPKNRRVQIFNVTQLR